VAELNQSESRPNLLDKAISTGLGSGFSPIAPGTAGSLIGAAVYLIPGFEKYYVIVPAIILFFFWGSRAAGKMERAYGHDPSRVVIDEIVGMWISLLLLPRTLVVTALSFVVFRVLDIVKPFPANYFDRKSGGTSIMLDDVVCGIYTNVLMQLTARFVLK